MRLGKIIPHQDIKQFNGETVEFVDGTSADFDLIVYCTGYNLTFPMLSPEVLAYKNGVPQLVNDALIPGHRNIIVVGIGQPRYGAGSLIVSLLKIH